MQRIGRLSAFVIAGLFLANVVLGRVQAVIPQRGGRGNAVRVEPQRSLSPLGSERMLDASRALSGSVRFFGNRIFLDVEVQQFVQTRKEVRLALVVTPRTVEGYVPLQMDRLAVDAGETAIVTSDGAWLHVKDVHGIGLFQASEMLRSSPIYVIGVPRRVELIFPVPAPSLTKAILVVRWAPGRTTLYPESWRTGRSVDINLAAFP